MLLPADLKAIARLGTRAITIMLAPTVKIFSPVYRAGLWEAVKLMAAVVAVGEGKGTEVNGLPPPKAQLAPSPCWGEGGVGRIGQERIDDHHGMGPHISFCVVGRILRGGQQ